MRSAACAPPLSLQAIHAREMAATRGVDPRESPRPLRLCVALSPPPGTRAAAEDLLAALRRGAAGREVRWVDPDRIHLTVQFLGSVPAELQPGVEGALAAAARGCPPLTLRLEGAGAFPGPRRARVLWAGLG